MRQYVTLFLAFGLTVNVVCLDLWSEEAKDCSYGRQSESLEKGYSHRMV